MALSLCVIPGFTYSYNAARLVSFNSNLHNVMTMSINAYNCSVCCFSMSIEALLLPFSASSIDLDIVVILSNTCVNVSLKAMLSVTIGEHNDDIAFNTIVRLSAFVNVTAMLNSTCNNFAVTLLIAFNC